MKKTVKTLRQLRATAEVKVLNQTVMGNIKGGNHTARVHKRCMYECDTMWEEGSDTHFECELGCAKYVLG